MGLRTACAHLLLFAVVGCGTPEPASCRAESGVALYGPECECPDGFVGIAEPGGWEPTEVCSEVDLIGCSPGFCAETGVCVDLTNEAAGCASAAACLEYVARYTSGDSTTSCVFPDLTRAMTGSFESIPCGDPRIAPGLCSQTCGCGDGELCYGVSEAHPVGACVPELRPGYRGPVPCAPEGSRASHCGGLGAGRCLTPVARPDWMASAHWARWTTVFPPGSDLVGGVCVSQARCEALSAVFPETWRCGALLPD